MDRKALRILIPILGFAPQGGYRVLSEIANAWIKLGHHCTFLIPASSPEPYFPTRANVVRVDRRGQVQESRANTKRSGFDNIMCVYAGLRKIGSNYDVWLANHSLTAWPVRWAGAPSVKKFYYIQAFEPLYYSFVRDPVKKLLSYGSYRLGLSMIANATVYPLRADKLRGVIPPGVDTTIFCSKYKKFKREGGAPITFGTIGRAEAYKGTETALSAYRSVRAKRSDVFLNVAIGNVVPADDLNITPISNDHQLSAFYREIDVLLVTCRGQHGAPHYPVIEAMASGTPVIHTGYFPGKSENSWVVNGINPEDVTAAIESFMQTPEAEIESRVQRARHFVENELSWPSIAQKFLDLFKQG